MKISPQKADGFCADVPAAVRAVLVYGPDNGGVSERLERIVTGRLGRDGDPMGLVTLSPGDIQSDPACLGDAAFALSLMPGPRVVRIAGAGDRLTGALGGILEGAAPTGLICLSAGDLGPRSSLRKLFEGSDSAAAIPCYGLDGAALTHFCQDVLDGWNKQLSPEAAQLLTDRLPPDRAAIRAELDKLALYLGDRRQIAADDVRACVLDAAEAGLDAIVWAMGDGDLRAVDREADRAFADGTSPVAILRAAQRHVRRLHGAAERLAARQPLKEVMGSLRPPVFFKRRPAFERQVRTWQTPTLLEAGTRLMDAEAACKQTGAPDRLICARVLMQTASLARRRRR